MGVSVPEGQVDEEKERFDPDHHITASPFTQRPNDPMTQRPNDPVPAAAVVALRGDEVLMVRRGKPPNEGLWSFPGGRIEPGSAT